MPTYRLPQAFGRKAILDEYGLCEPTADAEALGAPKSFLAHVDDPWIEEEDGRISGFRMPDGKEATAEDLERDAKEWAREFARGARSGMIQNHNHDCTDTCVKYANKGSKSDGVQDIGQNDKPKDKASSWIVPPCRFQFFVILIFAVLEGAKRWCGAFSVAGKPS